MDEKLDVLVHQLMHEASDPGEIHECPNCGGILHVHFLPFKRLELDLLEVNIHCEECKINIFTTYRLDENLPQWIKQK
jgi:hypothetical protein